MDDKGIFISGGKINPPDGEDYDSGINIMYNKSRDKISIDAFYDCGRPIHGVEIPLEVFRKLLGI